MNKNFFDGQRGFSFNLRAELLSMEWKSILRTFVGIVASTKETKAFLANLHEVNIALFKRLSTRKRLRYPLPVHNVIPTPCSDQSMKRVALEDLRCGK